MKHPIILIALFCPAIALPAFGQHGHSGVGTGAGVHGAPPLFASPATPATPATPSAHASGKTAVPTTSSAASTPATTAVANNPALSARLQTLLPAGTNVQTAAAGFRTTGQFIAAVHVANNLNIPFADLKARLTGSSPESLGRAIQDLRPSLTHGQIKSAVRTADQQTAQDLAANRLATQIMASSQLTRRVQNLLPAGMTLQTAASGFRNEGQFLAALHVSRNLGIPFAQLKAKLTGANAESLGRAIQDLRPTLSRDAVEADVETARDQARLDLHRGQLSS